MPFVPVPMTFELRMEFTIGNAEQMVNVLHFYNPDEIPLNGAVFEQLWVAVSNSWDSNLSALISDEVLFGRITAKDISAADLPIFSVNPLGAGANAADALPYPVSLVATLRTLVGSRGGRGRSFIGGWCEDANDGGDLATAPAAAAVKGFFDDIITVPITASDPDSTLFLGVTSRDAHVGGDPGGLPINPITRGVDSVSVNRRWDNQRRRSNKIRL